MAVQSTVDEIATCCLLAESAPIAATGKAPEVPQPSKTCCLHETFDHEVKPVVFDTLYQPVHLGFLNVITF